MESDLPQLRHFNVFTATYTPDPEPIFNGVRSSVRPLYRSPDGHVYVTSRKYPDGADYRLGSELIHDEVFYLVDGSVRCTPEGGRPILFEKGEVIYYPAGLAAHWEYSPNSQHLAFFWGDEPVGSTAPRPPLK
jgi:uncharacterized cupin superfamily protein